MYLAESNKAEGYFRTRKDALLWCAESEDNCWLTNLVTNRLEKIIVRNSKVTAWIEIAPYPGGVK